MPSANKRCKVRRIRADEGPALRAIRLAALADSPSAFGSSLERELAFDDALWETRAWQAAHGSRAGTFVVDGDREVAWCGLVTILGPGHEATPTTENAELVSMWIHPSARRKGIAVALLETAIEFSRTIHAKAIELSVTHDNAAAKALYVRCGFASVQGQLAENHPCIEEVRLRLHLDR